MGRVGSSKEPYTADDFLELSESQVPNTTLGLSKAGTLEELLLPLRDVDAEFYEPTIGHIIWRNVNGTRKLLYKSNNLPVPVNVVTLFSTLWQRVF